LWNGVTNDPKIEQRQRETEEVMQADREKASIVEAATHIDRWRVRQVQQPYRESEA